MHVAYDRLIPSLKKLLPARTLGLLGRAVAFIRRLREIHAGMFVWAVTLSRLGHTRPGFEQARQWYRRLSGVELWPRPFQMRFKSAAAVTLFRRAFETAVRPWRTEPRRPAHVLARHFTDVVAIDSTSMQVADVLRREFKGTRSSEAALKTLLGVSLYGLLPVVAEVVPGNRHDMVLFPSMSLFRAGTLLLFDKGFVAYDRLRQIDAASSFYLCPMRLNGNAVVVRARRAPARVRRALARNPGGLRLRDVLPRGKRIAKAWDLDVVLRPKTLRRSLRQVPARLVIVPGPRGRQRPYLTNLAPSPWAPAALAETYRLRWQIELVFKELKQHLNLESLPSKDAHAVQVFAWASLLALALSRTVATVLLPARGLLGLAAALRPAVLTRALRAMVSLVAAALVAPVRNALLLMRPFAADLLAEARAAPAPREDSFRRLVPLLLKAAHA